MKFFPFFAGIFTLITLAVAGVGFWKIYELWGIGPTVASAGFWAVAGIATLVNAVYNFKKKKA